MPLSTFFFLFRQHESSLENFILCSIFYVYHLIRKPTHVLDFVLTLLLNHLILTTYYSASLPTSLFFWLVMAGGAAVTVIFAEQFCVRREMQEGLGYAAEDPQRLDAEEGRMMGSHRDGGDQQENIEMAGYHPSSSSGSGSATANRS